MSVAPLRAVEPPAEPDALRLMTARDICALPDPPASDELLGPLLVRGSRLVLGGHTGEGKTTLGLQMVRAVVTGSDLLDWTGAGGRALVIDAEQGLRTIKRRLREADLAESDAIDYLRAPDGLRLDQESSEDTAAVEEVLRGGGYALVFADPLYKLHGGDSNEERAAVDFMRRLDAWRAELGFALILTTHVRKRQPQGGNHLTKDDLFGSGAYLRGAEVVLGLERRRPGYAHLHFFKDRDGDLPVGESWGLLFDREEGFRRDPEDGKAKPTTAEQVRELVEADPGITTEALIEATGKAERTVRSALGALTKSGDLTGIGKPKRWSLATAEQEEMC